MTGYTIAELEEAIAAVIAGLDASDFAIGVVDAWAESPIPMSEATENNAARSHLAYSVTVESAPVDNDWSRGRALEVISVEADVLIAFLYDLQIPGGNGLTNQRLASEAARRILRAILANDWEQEVNVDLVDAYRPGGIIAGRWLPVEIALSVTFDLRI